MTRPLLLYDICRCPGEGCDERETCLRYLAIAQDKERPGLYSYAEHSLNPKGGPCEYKITAEKEKAKE